MKPLCHAERLKKGWKRALVALFLLAQLAYAFSYLSSNIFVRDTMVHRESDKFISITELSEWTDEVRSSIEPNMKVALPPPPPPPPPPPQIVEDAAKTAPPKQEGYPFKTSMIPWSKSLGDLSPAAIKRLNQMRKVSKMEDVGRVNFFDPRVPDQVEASLAHCMGKDFDLENKLLVVTTIDAVAIHRMPVYLSMISDRSKGNAEVLLLATGIQPEQIDMFCDFVKHNKGYTDVHVLMISDSTMDEVFKYKKQQRGILPHVPVATMARLLLPSLIGDIVETVLYLDIDVVLTESMRLNTTVIHHMCPEYKSSVHDICARESLQSNMHSWCDPATVNVLGLEDVERGYNAGVLVLNLARMREFGFSRFAAIISRSVGVNDQVIFVAYTQNSFSRMIQKYNIFDGQDKNNDGEIVHFAGQSNKPWNHWSRGHNIWRTYEQRRYLFVWSSFHSIPQEIIDSLLRHSRGRMVSVYCGGVSCFDQISSIGYPFFAENINSLRWQMKSQTPLQGFFSRMQMYKILMEESFSRIWSMALKLTVLYNRGGLMLPSGGKLIHDIPDEHLYETDGPWFGESRDVQHFFAYAKAKDDKILKLMKTFMAAIEKSCSRLIHDINDPSCNNLAFQSILQPNHEIKSMQYYDFFRGMLLLGCVCSMSMFPR